MSIFVNRVNERLTECAVCSTILYMEMDTVNGNTGPPIDFKIDWEAIGEGLDDVEQKLLPFLSFGVPYVQVADFFNIHKSTISKRLERNKNFARAVAEARKIVKWELHKIWLNQKAVKAWENLDYFLTVDPLETDESGKYIYDKLLQRQLLSEKAKMTRFTLEQLGLRIQKVEVEHSVPRPIFVGDSTAAAMVIEAVKKSGEYKEPKEIATEYRIVSGDGGEKKKMVPTEEEAAIGEPWDRKSGRKIGVST